MHDVFEGGAVEVCDVHVVKTMMKVKVDFWKLHGIGGNDCFHTQIYKLHIPKLEICVGMC